MRLEIRRDGPRLQLGQVQQTIEQILHGLHCGFELVDQCVSAAPQRELPQAGDQQAHGVDRLAQIVAGRGDEARLGLGGVFSLLFALAQFAGHIVDQGLQLLLTPLQPLANHAQRAVTRGQRPIGG